MRLTGRRSAPLETESEASLAARPWPWTLTRDDAKLKWVHEHEKRTPPAVAVRERGFRSPAATGRHVHYLCTSSIETNQIPEKSFRAKDLGGRDLSTHACAVLAIATRAGVAKPYPAGQLLRHSACAHVSSK